MNTDSLLSLEDVSVSYTDVKVLHDVSLNVNEGEAVSLIGRNGAGKTTTLRAVMGVIEPDSGKITFDGDDITNSPDYETTNAGIRLVPEDRQVYPDLTVGENLRMGQLKASLDGEYDLEDIFSLFPRLEERRGNKGSQLSGGEQQMLVIARALLGGPKLLLLDEPTEGLAPQIVRDVMDVIEEIKDKGITVLLVEQNIRSAMQVSHRHYILNKGRCVFEGSTEELKSSPDIVDQYLGVDV